MCIKQKFLKNITLMPELKHAIELHRLAGRAAARHTAANAQKLIEQKTFAGPVWPNNYHRNHWAGNTTKQVQAFFFYCKASVAINRANDSKSARGTGPSVMLIF